MATTKKKTAQTVPYGVIIDPDTGDVIDAPEQQKVIDRIVRDYWQGYGFKMIADMLNDDGVPSARGKKWHPAAVRNVWGAVDNNRMARISKDDEVAAKEAKRAVEASPEVIAFRQRHDADHQFAEKGFYDEQISDINTATGESTGGTHCWNDKAKWDQCVEQDAVRLAEYKASEDAYLALTDKERADLHNFEEPLEAAYGVKVTAYCKGHVDEVVKRETDRLGEELRYWIKAITGGLDNKQAGGIKKKLTFNFNKILEQCAIQRQMTLHYHQEFDKAVKANGVGEEAAKVPVAGV